MAGFDFIIRGRDGGVERALRGLEADGLYPSFDLLCEAVLSELEALRCRRGYLDLLDLLAQLGRDPMAGRRIAGGLAALEFSLKLSALTPRLNVAGPEGTLRCLRPALALHFSHHLRLLGDAHAPVPPSSRGGMAAF